MNTDTIQKQCRDLKPGDVLSPTGRTVVWAGQTARTPAGKVTVHLTREGHGPIPREFHFGRGTVVSIHA